MKQCIVKVILLLFAIPLFFLNIHNTHSSGGDDYALYIKEAQNIANGRPFYESDYVFNKYNNCYSPPQYPPGFPLLLAPVVKTWGLAIKPMCYFNTMIACFLLFCFFAFFRKHLSELASLCLSVVITYSSAMIEQKQFVLSDASSLLFIMLYLIFRSDEKFRWWRIAVLIIASTMACLIRTQSILLIFAEFIFFVVYLIQRKINKEDISLRLIRKIPSLYIIAGSLVLLIFLNKTIFYCPNGAGEFYTDFLGITLNKGLLTIMRDNVNAMLATIMRFFYYETENSFRTALVTLMQSAGIICCLTGFVLCMRKRFCFDDIFFLLCCGLVLYYPIHDPRYFYPAIAMVFYYCYVALKKILPVLTPVKLKYAGVALTCIYLFAGFGYFKAVSKSELYGGVPQNKDSIAFKYIMHHVNKEELIVCARPRMISLYTDRRCMIHAWQHSMLENKRIFDEMNVKYLLLTEGFVDEYYKTYLKDYGHPTDSVKIADGYTLYSLK